MSSDDVLINVKELLWGGPFVFTDGGLDCQQFLEYDRHYWEGLLINAILVFGIFVLFRHRDALEHKLHDLTPAFPDQRRRFDMALGLLNLAVFAYETYYKLLTHRAVLMLGVCHVITMCHILALLLGQRGSSFWINSFALAAIHCPFTALLQPDLAGRATIQELVIYWAQHLLIALFNPLYLLYTRPTTACSRSRFARLLMALLWLCYHFMILSPLSYASHANINYALCPPNGFEPFGKHYRVVTFFVILFSCPLAPLLHYALNAVICRITGFLCPSPGAQADPDKVKQT